MIVILGYGSEAWIGWHLGPDPDSGPPISPLSGDVRDGGITKWTHFGRFANKGTMAFPFEPPTDHRLGFAFVLFQELK